MAAAAAQSVLTAFFGDWDAEGSKYIRPELYAIRRPINSLLMILAALVAYPQIIGQDNINCMSHIPCNISESDMVCGKRLDGYVITDLPYNYKLHVDDYCRKNGQDPYRYYLLYILTSVALISLMIQRFWRIMTPFSHIFVDTFLSLVKDCEKDMEVQRLITKVHMPNTDNEEVNEARAEENIQVIEHFMNWDDELTETEKMRLISLIDRANDLRNIQQGASLTLSLTCIAATVIHFVLSVAFIIGTFVVSPVIFPQEFFCEPDGLPKNSNVMICMDLQSYFYSIVRLAFLVSLAALTGSRLLMELRLQWLLHITYKGNLRNILRFKIYQPDNQQPKRHRNLLLLMICLKLYDRELFKSVSLLMSEQMNEVRRRQKIDRLVRHLQSVVAAGQLGCVKHFIRQLRIMHVPDPDGSLEDLVAEKGDVEVNLSPHDNNRFRAAVNAIIKAADGKRQAALHRGVQRGHTDIVDHLIQAGADVDVKDENEETPLHKAMRFGFVQVVEVLMKKKPDFKARNKDGLAPVDVVPDKKQIWDLLHVAIKQGTDLELINNLIGSGVDMNYCHPDHGTLLHAAVLKNSSRIVKLLIDNGAQLEIRDHRDRTPLQLAAFGASQKVVKVLVESGADTKVVLRDDDGKEMTLIDIARENRKHAIETYLRATRS